MSKKSVYSAKDGYNIIAKYYDDWKWQKFWGKNEYPLLINWCKTLTKGLGLDAGVGSGNNLKCFLNSGHKILGVDISIEMINLCTNKHKVFINEKKLICEELDIQKLIYNRNKFDWIICNRVISHIENINLLFRIFANILKPDGECFISNIHPEHNYSNTGITINNEKVYIETYKHSISLVKACIEKYGFDIIEFKEVGVNELVDKTIIIDFPDLPSQKTPIFYYFIIKLKQ